MDKDYNREIEGKLKNDYFRNSPQNNMSRIFEVKGPVIVGAGPSGLATAACLKHGGVDSLIIERADCIASLWQKKTYDRLHLHLPKHFCELPLMPFPSHFPIYPTKQHFISYLETYATCFGLEPVFNTTVIGAQFDYGSGFWRILTKGKMNDDNDNSEVVINEYLSKWLIVATGENAEEFVPNIEGMDIFKGSVIHTSCYRSGDCFSGKSVLVVGCGNSGMEVSLDLCNYNVRTSLVVRNTVHVLPQEMLGRSTFGLSMELLKWFPVRIVDHFLLLMSRFILGNTAELGLNRPKLGPLQLKSISGKTPVLDVGTISNIRAGKIKVVRGIKRLMSNSVEFVDGMVENFDAIILATGYTSNVPTWLKENSFFSKKNGLPCKPFPEGWKGGNGLYAVGFNKRGLHGTSMEAMKIAEDIQNQFNNSNNNNINNKLNQFQEPTFQPKNLESFLPT